MIRANFEAAAADPLRNVRHETFAQLVAGGESAAKAYVLAGFAPKSAYTCGPALLKRPQVRARAAHLKAASDAKAIDKAALSKAWVLSKLRLVVERAMQHICVLGAGGKLTGEYRFDGAVANRALELIGKELGMFTDRHEFTMPAIEPGRDVLPDDKLDAMIAAAYMLLAAKSTEETVVQ